MTRQLVGEFLNLGMIQSDECASDVGHASGFGVGAGSGGSRPFDAPFEQGGIETSTVGRKVVPQHPLDPIGDGQLGSLDGHQVIRIGVSQP